MVARRNLFKAAGVVGGASVLASYGLPAQARGEIEVPSSLVFERFEGKYHTFRSPKVVRTPDGTLLAFSASKHDSPADFSPGDVVCKRSEDGGRTWGEIEVVATDPPHRIGGTPVVDQRTGRITVIIVRIELDAPPDTLPRAYALHSDDVGRTWSEWNDITEQVTRPDWVHYVIGPPHGIQLRHGQHADRLVMPAWYRRIRAQDGNPAVGGVYLTYSDDGGDSWQLGALDEHGDGVLDIGESAVTELADGTVYVNTRNQGVATPSHRAVTRSTDGGESFEAPFEAEPEPVTPRVSASLLSVAGGKDGADLTLFCSEDHPSSRERLALWSSRDGAHTWDKSLLVYDGPAGYTDVVEVEPGVVGVLSETGPRLNPVGAGGLSYHQTITFHRVRTAWLDRPFPLPAITPDVSRHRHRALVSATPGVVPGVRRRAFELAGDYVELPLSDALLMGADPFTVALWFRTGADRRQRIANGYNYNNGPNWQIEVTSSQLRGRFITDAGRVDVRSGENYIDDQWHHVALRRANSDIISLFVDGQAVAASNPITGSVSVNAFCPIRLGARLAGINNPFVGAIDDFVLYGRSLPDTDIASLAEGASPPRDDSLLVHLPLDRRIR